MDKPESFEVTEYNDVSEPYLTFQTIQQIVQDYRVENPVSSHAFKVDFLGDLMKVTVVLYEMHVPQRIREVSDMAAKYQKEVLSYVKKEFKRRAKRDLSLKEEKDRADHRVESVSMNSRAYYICWYFYKLDV